MPENINMMKERKQKEKKKDNTAGNRNKLE
jgi:hypothetical protein